MNTNLTLAAKKTSWLIFLLILFHQNASSQNVGIGTSTPTQKLDVAGNVQFSGALMPAGSAGTTGKFLLSGGPAPNPPTWTTTFFNTPSTSTIGKFTTPAFDLPANTITTLIVTDANVVGSGSYPSAVYVNFAGGLGGTTGENANVRIYNVQVGTGQFTVVIDNLNAAKSYTGVQLEYLGFF